MPGATSEKVKSLNASNAPTQKARLSHGDVMDSRDDEQKVTRREENLRLRAVRKDQESNYNCKFINLTQEFTANASQCFFLPRPEFPVLSTPVKKTSRFYHKYTELRLFMSNDFIFYFFIYLLHKSFPDTENANKHEVLIFRRFETPD